MQIISCGDDVTGAESKSCIADEELKRKNAQPFFKTRNFQLRSNTNIHVLRRKSDFFKTFTFDNGRDSPLFYILDPPSVSIEGYDNNWYVGRTDAMLLCLANANPTPTMVSWTV